MRDPLNPPLVAHLNEADFGSQNAVHEIGLDVVGPGEAYLYVNNSVVNGRVDVLSVGDARDGIHHVATIDGISTHGVFAQDDFLYVAGEQTVTVFDVSDVGNGNAPLQGMFNAPGGFTHSSWPDTYVAANGQTRHVLYVTHESSGTDLQVWDVTEVLNGTDPAGAQLITSVTNLDLETTQGTGPVTNVHNLFLVGDTLFTSWTAAGMVVIDVSDPTRPAGPRYVRHQHCRKLVKFCWQLRRQCGPRLGPGLTVGSGERIVGGRRQPSRPGAVRVGFAMGLGHNVGVISEAAPIELKLAAGRSCDEADVID